MDPVYVQIDREIEDLIPPYMDSIKKGLEIIQSETHLGNLENVRLVGHKMKGSGGGYGFTEISELGAKIEEAAKNKDRDLIFELAGKLNDYIQNVVIRFV